MYCLYCNKPPRLGSQIYQDPDFCTPAHRSKFNQHLNAAIQRIRESSDVRPGNPAGFQQQPLALNCAYDSLIPVPKTCVQSVSPPASRLIRLVEEIALDPVTDTRAPRLKSEEIGQPVHQDARSQRLSTIVAKLREQVEERRSRRDAMYRDRAPAPVIELKRAI